MIERRRGCSFDHDCMAIEIMDRRETVLELQADFVDQPGHTAATFETVIVKNYCSSNRQPRKRPSKALPRRFIDIDVDVHERKNTVCDR